MTLLCSSFVVKLAEQVEAETSYLPLTSNVMEYEVANIILTDLPGTRQVAKERGSKYYYTGLACQSGHISERYTTAGKCCQCVRNRRADYVKDNYVVVMEKAKISRANNIDKINAKCRDRHHKNKARMNAISREYYRNNKERLLGAGKEYHFKNKEKRNEYSKQYRQGNKEKISELNRKWYLENKTRHYELQKKYRNTERGRTTSRIYREENPEVIRAAHHKRRALAKKAEGCFTAEDIKRIKAQQNNKCACCKCRLNKNHQIDHIYPLSKGGSNWPSNLQLLCKSCNSKKRAKLPDQWASENNLLV